MNIPFTKRYAPKHTKDVIGQDAPILKLKDFVNNFKKQKKKAMFISGPVGCGKTVAVQAIANELNYELLEINASDTRNSAAIESIVGAAIHQASFFHKGKIIMIDEAEGITGTQDRGGLTTLADLIDQTAFPIIIISNDAYDHKFSGIRKKCAVLDFNPLTVEDVFKIIKQIAEKEKIQAEDDILRTISRRSAGDSRAAITDLQVLAVQGKITREEIDALSYREKEDTMQDALIKVFKNSDPLIAIDAFERVDEQQDKLMLWVDENLPLEYTKREDLAMAYNFLSKADIFQKRIIKRQDWRFLVYINALITAGVAVSKTEKNRTPIDYKQTSRILKMWIMNNKYAKRKSIALKIAEKTHCSLHDAIQSSVPYIKVIFQKNKKMSEKLTDEFEFDQEEVEWLERKV